MSLHDYHRSRLLILAVAVAYLSLVVGMLIGWGLYRWAGAALLAVVGVGGAVWVRAGARRR